MNEDMDETQSPNPWPTGDVTPERFSLLIHEDQSVSVLDGETPVVRYHAPDALAFALAERARLVEREAAGTATPAKFLTEALPKLARQQRLEGMLAEVRTAESSTLAGLTDAITLLNRAVSLRKRLEKALETAVRPLSATEKPEQTPGVRQDTSTSYVWQKAALRLVEDSNWSRSWTENETSTRISTYKPQPY